MNNINYYILFYLLFSFLFSSVIDHQPNNTVSYKESLELEVFSDYQNEEIIKSEIYFKTDNQIAYIKENLEQSSNNYFNITLSSELIVGEYINYYFVFKLSNGEIITMPAVDPNINPYSVKVVNVGLSNKTKLDGPSTGFITSDHEIIAPLNNQKLLKDDVIISLSYFKIKDLSLENVRVYIDNIDKTSYASIRKNNLFMIPEGLSFGKHEIRVELETEDGVKFSPIIWFFYIYDSQISSDLLVSGKFWNNYLNNEIDDNVSSNNTSNLNVNISSDIISLESKFKKSTLESDYLQPYDRYYLKLNFSEMFNVEYGDFYPNIDDFILNGKRVRGIGLTFDTKWFQMSVINGDLERAIQGNPSNNSSIISDYYSCNSDECDYTFNISRNNYAFQKEVQGLSFRLGKRIGGINLGLNLLKVKDNVNSVQATLDGTIIQIPYESDPFNSWNSDDCLDIDGNNICNADDLAVYYDSQGVLVVDNSPVTPAESIYPCTGYLDEPLLSTINYDLLVCPINMSAHCNEGEMYNYIKNVWEVTVLDEDNNFQDFIESCSLENTDGTAYVFNTEHLEDDWIGDKPKDNITIGADIKFKSINNNFSFNSSIAMSLNNNNIWDPVLTLHDLDLLNDNNQDCYYERTYENTTEVSEWINCNPYNQDGTLITNLNIVNAGLNLNDIPEEYHPENLADYYHWNFNSVPLIPFYGLINSTADECNLGTCGNYQENNGTNPYVTIENCATLTAAVDLQSNQGSCVLSGGTWVADDCVANWVWIALETEDACKDNGGLWDNNLTNIDVVNEILDSPSIAYDLDLSFKINKHHFQYGIKKVGSEFHSSGNPYIQKDIHEQYFSDKVRLLNNKMYMSFKLIKIKNGILDGKDSFNTDKYDFNINYYPGINLPSLSLSFGSHYRQGGGGGMTWSEFFENCDVDNELNNENSISSIENAPGCYDDWAIYDTNGDSLIVVDEYPIFTNTKVDTKTDNYNIGYSQNLNFNRSQNININYYHSTKQDLIYNEMINQNASYLSPRSLNNSINANITTHYNSNFNSKIYFSNSEYNFGQELSDYYRNQIINRYGFGFNYNKNNILDNLGIDITYSEAKGTNQYNQLGIKFYTRFILFNNFNLNTSYRYYNKNQSSEKFYNNNFKISLFYKF